MASASSASASASASASSTTPTVGGLASHLHDPRWLEVLDRELKGTNFKNIETFLAKEKRERQVVFPPEEQIFTAFNLTPFDDVKVVVLGQDPYHGRGQGHGLSFSVQPGVAIPPSLRNIYKELSTDIQGFKIPKHGYLETWAKRGVLMLNATLTVREASANSHAKCGWQAFTDAVIEKINKEADGVVFLLWGGFAHKKAAMIDKKKHRVIMTAHPSPLSAKKFMDCGCFSKVNEALAELKKDPIDWKLPATL